MFKRRLAVLGAVCALALTGLAGSALADEPPSTAGAKVTCTTSDGKTIELSAAEPAKAMGVVVAPDGEAKKVDPGEMVKLRAVPAEKLPEGAEPPVMVKKVELAEGDAVAAVPAKPAEGLPVPPEAGKAPEGGHGKAVTIVCKKPE
ncbi:hypothetical protein ETD86_00085 [Nonomuraea turkmeniaca]|uniref:Uncharacterized protein n=1 Tax=Nonomuraea turkmeniaca TaxID=103838 RepID=A0A5S4FXN1_9ACTN|nr:hypothetical protein [Nonomuraea turkmeniaca]TMR25577.1 hypothetical protein ETD86_00085 [Nonomuraea turkmeniaca]